MHAIPLVAAMVAYLTPLVYRLSGRTPPWRVRMIVSGVILHALGIVMLALEHRQLPIASLTEGLAATALLVAGGAVLLVRRERFDMVADVLLGLATGLLLLSSITHELAADATSPPWFLAVHAVLIFVGFAGFAISFALSAVYLVLRRRLKNRDLKGIGKLPSLDSVDRLNFRSLVLGFVALTAGAAMGGVFIVVEDFELEGDITVWATALVWLWYAVGLQVRVVGGWRGRTAAVVGVVGFAGVTAILAVAGVTLGGWHGFGA